MTNQLFNFESKPDNDNLIYLKKDTNGLILFQNGDYYLGNVIGQHGIYSGSCNIAHGNLSHSIFDHSLISNVLFLKDTTSLELPPSTNNCDLKANKNNQNNQNNSIIVTSDNTALTINNINSIVFYTKDLSKMYRKVMNMEYNQCLICYPSSNEVNLEEMMSHLKQYDRPQYTQDKILKLQSTSDKKSAIKKKRIVCINFGISNLLLSQLREHFNLILLPDNVNLDNIALIKPDGLILSDGNRDYDSSIKRITEYILALKKPVIGFGIGMYAILNTQYKLDLSNCKRDNHLYFNNVNIIQKNSDDIVIGSLPYQFRIVDSICSDAIKNISDMFVDSYNSNSREIVNISDINNKIYGANFLPTDSENTSLLLNNYIKDIIPYKIKFF